MNAMTILICALGVAPIDCDERSARDVIKGETEGIMCSFDAQTKLARSPLLKPGEYMKVVCKRKFNLNPGQEPGIPLE